MSDTNNNIDDLEKQVEDLLNLCDKLTQSNGSLRNTVDDLKTERSTLIKQKDKARNHIESMITRLKSMENNP
jgi:cell division protein ZapB